MEKIELGTPDGAVENIEKIAELFPQVVTEVENTDGELARAVDFDALRDLLGDVAEGQRERYQFTWPGKREAKAEARRPIYKTMIPEPGKSKDWDTTENLYIEGDNLDALKILKETYAGKVKLIYIDPPYNTGHDFVYDDDFAKTRGEYNAESGDYDEEGGRLVANTEGNGRFHSDWCSMIYPRLTLARDLLAADGTIFISIDENEANNLEKICDEVFGRANFLTRFIWRKVDSPNDNHVVITPDHEYIFAYCKNAATVTLRQRRAPELVDAYNGPDENGRYWRDRLLRKNGKNSLRADRPTMYYALTAPDGSEVWPIREDGREGRWAAGPSSLKEIDARGDLIWKQRDGKWVPYTREYAADNPTKPWMTIWNDLPAMRQTKAGMKDLFGISNVFDTPKPPALIQRCMELGGVKEGEIVLDFFSGSAATAHAALDFYSNEEVAAKWILVQIPELLDEGAEARQFGFKSICDLGEERIRRAGEKIANEIDESNKQLELGAEPKPYPDLGFRVLRIDSSNFKDFYLTPGETSQESLFDFADNVKEGRSELDLLFEVLPKLGIPYSAKIEERVLAGKKVFFVDGDKLAACFDANVGSDTIEEMAKAKPWYAVIRDSSMADDATHANYEELFRTYSPDTVPQVI
ncbi:site-specific DNA-methyltransferase [Slackia isoflavoniconvertens]|uniref:Site-specific DNA-methyltransferase n=1 Tax=Slackia isoflavoniconvertens TaxID=572010 RepID=A0A3N0IFI8_9ACTN|nr:site-specific DNA-methyltransferase [Slackia isoflavoniconvertens]MBB3278933.1 adenine-specific DNA-methyltransferase [Slackia isoflavoniconvertens]RNM35829.1 site-specific DNA-methyltransferase [Slackia isoflavoniconvertens]